MFEVKFASNASEVEARAVCGDDKSCLYDAAATGNVEFAKATLETHSGFEEEGETLSKYFLNNILLYNYATEVNVI